MDQRAPMEEEYLMEDTSRLLEAASDFALYPGVQNDAAVKELLDRFPLPVIISALQTRADVPGLESTLVNCLERVFKTKYGASLIPHFMPFVQVGLQAASQEVRCLACKTNVVFPASDSEVTHLRNLAAQCSSLGRVWVLALIVKLFPVSSSVASIIYSSNLLSLFEAEISDSQDTLVTLSVLELLYEMVEIRHATEILWRTALLQLLASIISNALLESILRSRAMMICGRLLSKEDTYMLTDESTTQGAELLLSSTYPVARHVVYAAFDRQGRGKQLAALHALGNLAGDAQSDNSVILNGSAEETLRLLIYEAASRSPKLIPSGLFLSVLQQEAETRLAGYRPITALVARPWCLMEICSKEEIVDIVTDPSIETTKIGMEARYGCCQAIHKLSHLQDAVRRGPFLARRRPEAQPVVMTAERF
ncbi:hypothetical protein EUGRSUZ_F00890 [Eucalyptus grandis]|uniref:Uncharacterized protein n=1 Tax=Eucalyptus grandis TaxID=71139 RepID=A0ACC3KEX9_EUCGR|nr:hypothetical protein EUGRSUZ_F00890 [Eucalyptus grandis]